MRHRVTRAGATLALTALAALVVGTGGVRAQEGPVIVAQGAFELQRDGEALGREIFEIRREGETVRAVGRISLDGSAGPLMPAEVWLQSDSAWMPQMMRFRPASGDLRQAVAVREGDRLRLQIATEAGERWKEFMAPAELSLIDPRVAHHYVFLLRQHGDRLADGGAVSVPAVVPYARDRVTIRMERTGEGRVSAAGATRNAVRYRFVTGDLAAIVWADGGSVLRVEWPDSGIAAVLAPGGR